jgi:hypothetical protein
VGRALEILTDLAYNVQVGVEQMAFSSVVACLSLASDYSPGSRELTYIGRLPMAGQYYCIPIYLKALRSQTSFSPHPSDL